MEKQKKILIRADGNPYIATGHLMRCLSIASALRRAGASVSFAVADEVSARLLSSFCPEKDPYPIHILDSDYRHPDSELDALRSLLLSPGGTGFDCLLIDSYFVTPGYLEALRPLLRTAYIDDLYSFDYPVDLIINYDFAPPEDFYKNAADRLLGPSFTPLRPQFRGLSYRVRPQVCDLLISTGGTDDADVAGRLLEELTDMSFLKVSAAPPSTGTDAAAPGQMHWQYHVLAGPMHAHRARLQRMADLDPSIHLYEKVTDMAALMARCDLAVSAAGTTLYELCAVGLPAVSFTMADNQLATARDMQRFVSLPYAGDTREEGFLPRLASHVRGLAQDASERQRLSNAMQKTVDGNGADRIAAALLSLKKR